MTKTHAAAAAAALAFTAGTGWADIVSDPVDINASPSGSRFWSTVFTNEVPLTWDWATGAASARLEITGMNSSLATNFTEVTTHWLWQVFPSAVPASEDVYDLTLTFYTSGSVVTGALNAHLAVVAGAFGKAEVDPAPESRTWGTVDANVVIPYDAGWTNATAGAATSRLVIEKDGGTTQTNEGAAAAGYFGWKIRRSLWGYGTFSLTLTFPDKATNQWDASLVRMPDGTMVRVQ